MIWTQKAITDWAVHTFGEPESVGKILARATQELEEALLGYYDGVPGDKLVEELADTYIVMCQAAEHLGYDLIDQIQAKMEVNVNRKWKVNNDGTGQHE